MMIVAMTVASAFGCSSKNLKNSGSIRSFIFNPSIAGLANGLGYRELDEIVGILNPTRIEQMPVEFHLSLLNLEIAISRTRRLRQERAPRSLAKSLGRQASIHLSNSKAVILYFDKSLPVPNSGRKPIL